MPTIRPALWTDHARLVPLVEEFAAFHHRLDPTFRPRWLGFTPAIFQTWLAEPEQIHLVAVQDDEIAGYVSAGRGGGNDGIHVFMRRNIFVYVLAVAEPHRRRGIGRALFGAIEHSARAFDAEVIQLNVVPSNDRAKAFYRALGYGPTGEVFTKPLRTVIRIEGTEP